MNVSQLPLPVLYYGSDRPLPPPPPPHQLQAGPLSLIFEAGDLRYIRCGNDEILRRIYVAVRDHNWQTVPAVISNLQLKSGPNFFSASFAARHQQAGIDFSWTGNIEADERGTITYTMDGEAHTTFLRNRIGICVLHPIRGCAGRACRIDHVDGTTEQGMFPTDIAPHQPFKNIRAIWHEVAAGVRVKVEFAGDTFEMEDQRNWTDGSFKTYSTPVDLPLPVEVKQGTKIVQKVTLMLQGELSAAAEAPKLEFRLEQPTATSMPRIGLSTNSNIAAHGQPFSSTQLARLKTLNLSHLRVDLNLSNADYQHALRQAADEATALGASLEVALFLSDAAAEELVKLTEVVEIIKPPVCSWLIFHIAEKSTTAKWVELARKHLPQFDSTAKIGAGTNLYFTELNRQRPPAELLDIICYSFNPQVHAFDNSSLIENLEAQGATITSARRFAAGLPIAITPVTLKPRSNPDAAAATTDAEHSSVRSEELPASVDVRQMSLLGAVWTAGSLKQTGEGGAHSVTYFETIGWHGVMEHENGSPLPGKFRSLPGGVFPLYHVLADIGEFAGGEVIRTTSSDSLKIDGVAVRREDRTRVVLANLTLQTQQVSVYNLGESVRVKRLDETNVEEAMLSPEEFRARPGDTVQTFRQQLDLGLPPYGLIRIDALS